MPEPSASDLDRLIARLYEAAMSDDLPWQAMVQELVQAVGARTGWLAIRPRNADAVIVGSVGIGPDALRAYRDYYASLDLWAHAVRRVPTGLILPSHNYYDPKALSRTELYADWIHPHLGDSTWGTGTVLGVADGERATFALHRLRSAGAFSSNETRLLRRLNPHLRNALLVRHRIGNLQRERNRALNVLAEIQTAALVLAGNRNVKFATPEALQKLKRGDGLRIAHGALQAATQTGQARLDHAIACAADAHKPSGTLLRLARPSGASDWAVLIAPFAVAPDTSGEVLCLIRDPEMDLLPPERHLAAALGLTRSEARVAAALAQGKSPEVISQEFGVSRNTVRNQIQGALTKTGTSGQVQLVRLILNLPGAPG